MSTRDCLLEKYTSVQRKRTEGKRKDGEKGIDSTLQEREWTSINIRDMSSHNRHVDSIDRSRPRTLGSTTTKPTLRELHESIPISLLLSPQADCEISAQQKLSEIWQSNNPIDTIIQHFELYGPPQNRGMASYRKMFNLYHLRWVIYCSYPLPNTIGTVVGLLQQSRDVRRSAPSRGRVMATQFGRRECSENARR